MIISATYDSCSGRNCIRNMRIKPREFQRSQARSIAEWVWIHSQRRTLSLDFSLSKMMNLLCLSYFFFFFTCSSQRYLSWYNIRNQINNAPGGYSPDVGWTRGKRKVTNFVTQIQTILIPGCIHIICALFSILKIWWTQSAGKWHQ